MAEKELKINQKINLKIETGPYQGEYPSKVAEINENQIKVLPPYEKGELLPLRTGRELKVLFTGESAAYFFESEVLSREREEVPLLVLTPPQEIERIQRRKHFRLKVNETIYYRKLDEEEEPIEEFHETKTADLSAGGVRMVLDRPLDRGEILELRLEIDDLSEVPILGKVVQLYDLPDGHTKAAGIKFIDINPRSRDAIMGWMFEYQRKLRRRGML